MPNHFGKQAKGLSHSAGTRLVVLAVSLVALSAPLRAYAQEETVLSLRVAYPGEVIDFAAEAINRFNSSHIKTADGVTLELSGVPFNDNASVDRLLAGDLSAHLWIASRSILDYARSSFPDSPLRPNHCESLFSSRLGVALRESDTSVVLGNRNDVSESEIFHHRLPIERKAEA